MAFGYSGTRRYGRRRRFVRRARVKTGSAKSVAFKALKIARVAKSRTKAMEWNYIDTESTGIGVTYGSDPTYIVPVAQGDTSASRSGTKVLLKSILIRGSVTTSNQGIFRLVLVQDMDNAGESLSFNDLFSGSLGANMVYRPLTMDGPNNRYKILWSKIIRVDTGAFDTQIFKYYKRLNLPISFTGTTSSVGDAGKNALFFGVVGDNTAGQTTSWYARCRFTDA